MSVVRPIIRWAGSKRRILPRIIASLPQNFNRYIEPFAGSAVVFLALNPKRAVLNDINKDLIQTYKTVRRAAVDVANALREFPKSKALYYFLRAIPPHSLDPITRAARFIYLNRFSFNGVYRTNKRGEFNVPMGRKTGKRPSRSEIVRFSECLGRTTLMRCDFESVLNSAQKQDFVYLDPPYSNRPEKFFGEYGYDTFGVRDEARLVSAMERASSRGVYVLLSYNSTLVDRFQEWNTRHIRVKRSVAGFAKARKTVSEVLIANY